MKTEQSAEELCGDFGMKQMIPTTFSAVLFVSFCASSCDETKDNSAKPKTIATGEAQNDEATEDTEVAEGASFRF